jgi:hypothetical protein
MEWGYLGLLVAAMIALSAACLALVRRLFVGSQ